MDYLIICILGIIFILAVRVFGAWMLRINELININREILRELKKR